MNLDWEDTEECKILEQELQESKMMAKEYLDNFREEIKGLDRTQINKLIAKPQRMKIPFKVKVRRFFDKLNRTLS